MGKEMTALEMCTAKRSHSITITTQQAMNTAVNAVVQIEPFKFFHNINDSIISYHQSHSNSQTTTVGSLPGRSNKPAGMAHLGELKFFSE